jgi:hypothetical protein
MRASIWLILLVASALGTGVLTAQAPTPACALLTVDDVKRATGNNKYPRASDGDEEGEGAGGGSSCQYGGPSMMTTDTPPMLSFVLIKGKGWTARARTFKLAPGCTRENVSGVGDDAFFEVCSSSRIKRTPPLYVKKGTNDIIVQLDVEPPLTAADAKGQVIAVAKAAVAKLQ